MKYQYKPHQKYVTFNHDDKDLRPLVFRLPDPPELKYIDGCGDDPVNQKWMPLKVPEKLITLEETALANVRDWVLARVDRRVTEYRVMEEFWKLLEENKSFYREEIKYIEKIHFHLYYGYWLFIYGTPTWIPPTYFRYLNFWYYPDVPGNKPEYRDADRRAYIFKWYCRTTNETLGNLDENGLAQKDEKGNYEIIECPTRTVYGHAKVKRRREGATNQECSDMLWTAERNYKGDCVIMADTGKSAKDIFDDYMLPGFVHQPLFLKPIHNTYPNSSEIKFVPPPQEYGVKSLMSTISFIETAGEGGVDRMKLYDILGDEGAKLTRNDASRRHGVSKPTTAQSRKIHGYMAYPSTVEEMEEGGGAYRDIWDNSDFYVRDPYKNTISGLLRIFQPACDGLDGYIDAWGYSVENTPTTDQLKHAPIGALYTDGIGARELIQSKIDQLLRDGSPAKMKEYREWIRKNPLTVAHCWIGTAGDIGFDTVKLDERDAELYRFKQERKRLVETGNLKWKNGVQYNPLGVEFVRDEMNGRFNISNLMINRQNKWKWTPSKSIWNEREGAYVYGKMPFNPLVTTAGADAFDYGNIPDKKTKSMMSDGGIYVMINYDEQTDGGKKKEEWATDTTICTYRYRPPSVDEFYDDVIKCIVFFQAMLVIERNKSGIWRHIIENGYGGYLVYMVNPDGTMNKEPGVWTGQGMGDKDRYFDIARDYISDHIHREKHADLIREMKSISSPKELRHNDLLTAFMIARLGSQYGHHLRFARVPDNVIHLAGTRFDPYKRR
jgi:hypothetical protein